MIKAEVLSINGSQRKSIYPELGDLEHYQPDIRTFVLNSAMARALEGRTASDDISVREEVQRLKTEITEFRNFVREPSNYPSGAKEEISKLYEEADDKTVNKDMETRVSARLSQFNGIHVVLDYDNTITDNAKPINNLSGLVPADDHLKTLIPASFIGERKLKELGRARFPEVYAETWQYVLRDNVGKHIYRINGAHTPIREGVNEFFAYAKTEANAKLTVVSANLEPYVMGGLDQIPEAEGVNVFAVTDKSIISTVKDDLLLHLAQEDPQRAMVFIGDGASDLPTLQAREVVACYFALEESEFAEALKQEGLPCFTYTYNTFHDIARKFQELKAINQSPS